MGVLRNLTRLSKQRVTYRDPDDPSGPRVDPESVQSHLDRTVDTINGILGAEILFGRQIDGIQLTAGATTIVQHGLNREPKGYLLGASSEGLPVKHIDSPRPKTELHLTCLSIGGVTTTTISIWVY